jgi:translation initiation factor 2A
MHAVGAPSSGITVRLPPGAAPAQPALSKSAEKRKKKKENSATSRADNATNSGTEASREGTPTAQGAGAGPTGSTPEEKKIRGLLKKLRAIEDLKVRQANGDKLEDTQVQKISTENSVRADLAKLGWSG